MRTARLLTVGVGADAAVTAGEGWGVTGASPGGGGRVLAGRRANMTSGNGALPRRAGRRRSSFSDFGSVRLLRRDMWSRGRPRN